MLQVWQLPPSITTPSTLLPRMTIGCVSVPLADIWNGPA
jgi:hypothetical protein